MAVVAKVVSGIISVGEETSPDYNITLDGDGGTITQNLRQLLAGLVGASTTALDFGNVSKASMVWIKGTDASGDPKKFKMILNSVTVPEVTEMAIFSKTPTTGFTSVSVVNDVGTSALLDIEYSIAG